MLKFQYQNAEEIPEGLQDYYIENEDGSFTLKVDGAVDKLRLDEFRTNNKVLMEELKTAKDNLTALDTTFDSYKSKYGDIDIESYNEMVANQKALRDQTLIDEGKHKELLAIREDELRNEFAGNQQKLRKELDLARKESEKEKDLLQKQLATLLIDNKITALATQYAIKKGALPDVLARGAGTWVIEDGQAVAYDGTGNKLYEADGISLLSVETWMESLSTNAAHLFEPSSGSGDDVNIAEIEEFLKPEVDEPENKTKPGEEYMIGPLADIREGLDAL